MADVIDILSLDPHSLNLRSHHLWLDYDDEADVLYISLRKPQRTTDSEMAGASSIITTTTNWLAALSCMPNPARGQMPSSPHASTRLAAP
jgi:hypothetical protein